MGDAREIVRRDHVLPRRDGRDELEELRPVLPTALVDRAARATSGCPRAREFTLVGRRRRESSKLPGTNGSDAARRSIGLGHRQPRRVDEDEPPHEARVAAHEVERHRASERVAEEVHAPGRSGQRLDGADDDVGEKADAVLDAGAGGLVGPAVSEQVDREDSAAAGRRAAG